MVCFQCLILCVAICTAGNSKASQTFDVCVILECLCCLQRAGSVLLEAAEFTLPLLFASYSTLFCYCGFGRLFQTLTRQDQNTLKKKKQTPNLEKYVQPKFIHNQVFLDFQSVRIVLSLVSSSYCFLPYSQIALLG